MNSKYYLKPGYIFFSSEGHIIETVLGSCVSVSLWDKRNKMGVMTHYIYASYREEERKAYTGKIALPFAYDLMIKKGSLEKDLVAFVAGGGENPKLSDKVSKDNVQYALEFLKDKKIKVEIIDVGNADTRKAIFNSETGEFIVKHL